VNRDCLEFSRGPKGSSWMARGWWRKKKRVVWCRENEIIGATSKTCEPRGYPRGNVIGSWARGGPFGGVFWVCAADRRETEGNAGGERLAVSRFESGASACRRGGPKPPQSATTKTPRSLFHERPGTPLDPSAQRTRICIRTDTRVPAFAPLVAAVREKKRPLREGGLS